jgi:signal transduction histidine kinase
MKEAASVWGVSVKLSRIITGRQRLGLRSVLQSPAVRGPFSRSLAARLLGSVLALVLAAVLLVSAAAIFLLPTEALDSRIIAIFFALGVVTLVAVGLDVYFLAQSITEPLRRLGEATRAVAQGELDAPLEVRRQDEIGALADDFRRMQRELAASRQALEAEKARFAELNQLKERLLANVPHEIKTPLSAIGASLELLREDDGSLLPAERARLLQSIHRSVLRLQALVDNMLDAASIQAGQFRLRPEATRLGPILEEARQFLDPLLDQNGQRLEVCDHSRGALVRADPARLTQVLINLVFNASKHGDAASAIRVEAALEGENFRVQVHNHGRPVPDDVRQRLFEPFARGALSENAPPGAGLGLAIARTIVEMHHGAIGLTSTAEAGTTAWFTLPLAGATADDDLLTE